jgi:hypothetical protein
MLTKKVAKVAQNFECNMCDYITSKKSSYDKHLLTAKHIRLIDVRKVAPEKVAHFYKCLFCHYSTSKKSSYGKHLLTAKHLLLTSPKKVADDKLICSLCSKKYNSRVGLWSHKKKCVADELCNESEYSLSADRAISRDDEINNTGIIMEIIKENKEFKTLLIEQCKNTELQQKQSEQQQQQLLELQRENNTLINKMVEITQNQMTLPTTINNNTINNNQKFNLNFFLNETCKDAMNINEFIENIKITFQDLLTIGNSGFVNGVSDILLKQLKDLDVTKRPIHCTDSKRETIYLKENNSWNKDNKENNKLKTAIEKVEYKNVAALQQWCNENPDSKVNNTTNNLLRDKIYLETLQGDERNRDKIIKNLSKEVIVDK